MSAEAAGAGALWAPDHPVMFDPLPESYPYTSDGRPPFPADTSLPDPLITVSEWATARTRLLVGCAGLVARYRNPYVLAKQLGSLWESSEGSFRVAVGAGWSRPTDLLVLDEGSEARWDQTDRTINQLRTVASESLRTESRLVVCRPSPREVPMLFAGASDHAVRRASDSDGLLTTLSDRVPDDRFNRIKALRESGTLSYLAVVIPARERAAATAVALGADELIIRLPGRSSSEVLVSECARLLALVRRWIDAASDGGSRSLESPPK
jgi:alkanesulfonate monooxygenase SsuD/methylene tetrahydromethanopterin reductase-like flavin-dependent oxidoreductase (luciferase family)